MPYFDYSATTPLDPKVAQAWLDTENQFFANANSSHALGKLAAAKNQESLEKIASLLKIFPDEFILTASAVESNNLAIKGLALKYPSKKHIISSKLEHASVIATLASLGDDYTLDWMPLDDYGRYDVSRLASLLKEDTLVVSLVAVDSETGIRQPVEEIAHLCREKGIYFHCDATQAIGKTPLDLSEMDLVSLSAHKLYGPKGAAGLIKKRSVKIVPLFHGGHSITPYRASTPATALLAALAKALELQFQAFDERFERVKSLSTSLQNELIHIPNVQINSNAFSIPHILNISILNTVPEEGIQLFSNHGIYLSSKSACSGQEEFSASVFAVTHDHQRAISSYRISLSHLTTQDEISELIHVIKELA